MSSPYIIDSFGHDLVSRCGNVFDGGRHRAASDLTTRPLALVA